jgi:hypothetical protein
LREREPGFETSSPRESGELDSLFILSPDGGNNISFQKFALFKKYGNGKCPIYQPERYMCTNVRNFEALPRTRILEPWNVFHIHPFSLFL